MQVVFDLVCQYYRDKSRQRCSRRGFSNLLWYSRIQLVLIAVIADVKLAEDLLICAWCREGGRCSIWGICVVASFTLDASGNIPSKTYLYSIVRIEEVRNQAILDCLFPVYCCLFLWICHWFAWSLLPCQSTFSKRNEETSGLVFERRHSVLREWQ